MTVATVSLFSRAASQTTRAVLVFTPLAPELWTAGRKSFSGPGLPS